MRDQTKKMKELHEEFKTLKTELFGNEKFVQLDEADPKTQRYNQLFMFLYPQYRTRDYKSPLD